MEGQCCAVQGAYCVDAEVLKCGSEVGFVGRYAQLEHLHAVFPAAFRHPENNAL